jgi:hypothetical protein
VGPPLARAALGSDPSIAVGKNVPERPCVLFRQRLVDGGTKLRLCTTIIIILHTPWRSEHVDATHGAQYTMRDRDARTSRSEIMVSCSVASPGGPGADPEVLDPVPPHPDFVGGEVGISGIPIWPGSGKFPGLRPNLVTNPGSGTRRTRRGAPPQRPLLTLVGFVPVPFASKGAWAP